MNDQENISTRKNHHQETIRQDKETGYLKPGIRSFTPPDSLPPIVDNRPESIIQRKQQEMMNNSPQVKKGMDLQFMMDNSPKSLSEKNRLDYLFENNRQIYSEQSLPSLNESRPIQQQKQGNSQSTLQMKKTSVNDSSNLEKEADEFPEKQNQKTSHASPSENRAVQDDYRTRIENRKCRFMSVDPLAGEIPELSKYCYANRNPVMMNDPTGGTHDKGGTDIGGGLPESGAKEANLSYENKKFKTDKKSSKINNTTKKTKLNTVKGTSNEKKETKLIFDLKEDMTSHVGGGMDNSMLVPPIPLKREFESTESGNFDKFYETLKGHEGG